MSCIKTAAVGIGLSVLFVTHAASAAEYGFRGIIDPHVPAGFHANELFWDGHGTFDWTNSGLRIDLSVGSFYNHPLGGNKTSTPYLYGLEPALEFDTAVGIPSDGSGGIPGGAGDLGAKGLSLDAPQLSVSWYNTFKTDVGFHRIGMVTLSDDAVGTGSLWMKGEVRDFTIGQGRIDDTIYSVGGSTSPRPDPNTYPGAFPNLQLPPTPSGYGVTLQRVSDPGVPEGYVAYRIVWNGQGATDWSYAGMRLDLDSGDLYQHPAGTDLPPNPAFIDTFPELPYDTHFGIAGDPTSSISGGARTIGTGALGGNGVFNLEPPYIDVSWYNYAEGDTGTVQIGMLTLSEDANGTIGFEFEGGTWGGWIAPIQNGSVVPEPATLALLGISTVCLIRLHRRR